jgi:hypothetical protein
MFGTPSAVPGAGRIAAPDVILYWRCNAWPVTGLGAPTYGISFSAAFASYQVLASCTSFNGVACFYNCFPAY